MLESMRSLLGVSFVFFFPDSLILSISKVHQHFPIVTPESTKTTAHPQIAIAIKKITNPMGMIVCGHTNWRSRRTGISRMLIYSSIKESKIGLVTSLSEKKVLTMEVVVSL